VRLGRVCRFGLLVTLLVNRRDMWVLHPTQVRIYVASNRLVPCAVEVVKDYARMRNLNVSLYERLAHPPIT
jgi:hypothetical protein